ncbi:hypothetical protein ABQG65_22910 [Yersinia alsatica]|uniref:hypothetical protein n=1 Tax=Yersinia alsatica TaxID=2890317 RepID=UPI0032ED01DF
MSEQTNKIISDLLLKASNGIDSAVTFSQAQMPDVIEQLMRWKMASYGLRVFTCILLLALMCFFIRRSWQWYEGYEKETAGFVGLLLSGAITLISLLVLFANVGNAIQLWFAPKVWLIEYAADLIGTK